MNALNGSSETRDAVTRLNLAIERAEIVHALGRIDDRIYALKKSNAPSASIDMLERAALSLQRRLEDVRKRSGD